MLQLNTILVPTDFSPNSLKAAGQAAELARRFQSQITLLHVDEFMVAPPFTTEALRIQHVRARQKELQEFAEQELSGLPVKRIVCWGDPASVIVDRAFQQQSSLIVMPVRGSGVFRRLLLGSVTAKVIHDAFCPVWAAVHPELPVAGPGELRHVLCAVDFGPRTKATLGWAAGLSCALGAKLTVVYAVLDAPPNLPQRYAFQWHEESHSGARDRLHELLLDTGTTASVLVVSDGDVPKSLAGAAKATGADILVIGGTAGESSNGKPGSQTFSIICAAPCPVVRV